MSHPFAAHKQENENSLSRAENAMPEQGAPVTSRYGALNHFLIEEDLKDIANRYGLGIQQQKNGRFLVESSHGAEALNKIVEPFISSGREVESVELDRKDLKQFLSFLKQPIARTLPDKNQRRLGHNILRFATTGLVEIPDFVDENLRDAKSLECHEKGEHKMKQDDVWAIEPELWNAKEGIDSERKKIVSSIPDTTYEPALGFGFNIGSGLASEGSFQGFAQQKLVSTCWDILNVVTENRYEDQNMEQIYLSSNELQRFLRICNGSDALAKLVKLAQIEEKSQQKIESIYVQSELLQKDARFQIALSVKQSNVSVPEKIENLRKSASSILTPILASDVAKEAWAHSNFTERLMGLSDPINTVLEEYAVMKTAIDKLSADKEPTAADLQALVNNFRPLLSFSTELAEAIESATKANKKKFTKKYSAETLDKLSTQMLNMQTAFDEASVNGVSSGELSSDHEEVIEAVRNVMGQNGNVITQGAVGYLKMMKEFWSSAAQSAGDNVAVFGVISGFVGYAWWMKYGVDAQLMAEAVQPLVNQAYSGGFFDAAGETVQTNTNLSPEFLDAFQQDGESVIRAAIESGEVDECIVRDDCHYNKLLPDPILNVMDESVKKYLQFRHWVGKDIIASNAMTAQNLMPGVIDGAYTALGIGVDENATFINVSETVTNAGGELVVDANMWQDGSHAAMLAYGATRIGRRGARGFKQMTGLAAEFVNPSARMVGGVAGFAKRKTLQATASSLSLCGQYDVAQKIKISQRLEDRLMKTCVEFSGDETFALETHSPSKKIKTDIKDTSIALSLWAYGLGKETVNIGSDNVEDLRLALNEFGLTLAYSADDVGIDDRKHKDFLIEKLENIESVLSAYIQSPDQANADNLQYVFDGDLQHVLGSELKYADREKIYKAIFPESKDSVNKRRQGIFKRTAAKKEGRIGRAEYRREKWDEAGALKWKKAGNIYQKPERLMSLQSLRYSWGAVSASVKSGILLTKHNVEKTRLNTLGAFSYVGDAAVFAAREFVQEPVAQMPYKRAFLTAVGIGSVVSLPLDMAASINSPLVDLFSATGATATSVASTALIAAGINLPQDLALHTLAVYTSGAAIGVPWYYGVKKGIMPGLDAAREMCSSSKGFFGPLYK